MASRIYSVVAVITDDQGRYLAVSRKDNHDDLGFPGGKIEAGETPEEAIVRELHEETGLLASRRSLRSTFIAPDEEGRLCMAFDVMQHKGVAYSREGAWVGWAEPAKFLANGTTYRDYFVAFFAHKGITVDPTAIAEAIPVRPTIVAPVPRARPVAAVARPPASAPLRTPRHAARHDSSLEDVLLELTGVAGFPQHHITFLYGTAALAFCPVISLPQPRVTFDLKDFAGLLTAPVLGIRTHLQKSLIPLNLLRYMHSLGPRCVSALVAVSPHRPPEDWESVASNIIECQALQVEAKLTLKKGLAATKPVGASVIAPIPAGNGATTVIHQPLP